MLVLIYCLGFLNYHTEAINTSNQNTTSTCYSEESCLYDILMQNYNREVRPVTGPSGTVQVAVSVTLKTILALDERNEFLQTVLAVSAVWKDKFLSWENKPYENISTILISVKNLWLPDFAVSNSVDKFYQTTFLTDFRATIVRNGDVVWLFGGIFKTSCSLNIARYPFDSQTCAIIIENWAYPESQVNLTRAIFILDGYNGSSLWQIIGHKVEPTRYTVAGHTYPRLTFTLNLKRKSLYFVLNIIMPVIFVLMASLGVFLLPPGCGEKISLGITVLLAFSVFQIVITSSTPVNSDETPLISKGVISVMGLATLSVLTSMVAVYFHYKGPAKRMPTWLRRIAFHYLARLFCIAKEIPSLADSQTSVVPESLVAEEETPAIFRMSPRQNPKKSHANLSHQELSKNVDFTLTQNALVETLFEVRKITDHIKDQRHQDFIMDEWKLLARLIDKVLFVVAVFILFVILILLV